MQQFTEPLYVGVDVEALLSQLDHEDRHCVAVRRAAGRRSAPRRSPLDLEARLALGAEDRVALRGTPVA